jgi:hypothetical protein
MTLKLGWKIVSLLCLAATACAASCSRSSAQGVQESHIAGNIPDVDQFDTVLKRDLSAYFLSLGMARPKVTYEMLRIGPTQSGVAYPKYYLWASAVSDGGQSLVGALRVAAIERLRFEVTDFVSRDDVLAKPDVLASIFPAALLPSIRTKAAAP